MATTNLQTFIANDIYEQTGNGTPDHSAPLGSRYVDLDTGLHYRNSDDSTVWFPFVPPVAKGAMYISASSSTTISTADTPVKVAGTYATELLEMFDEPIDGRLRYTGTTTKQFAVVCAISMSGTRNNTYSFYVAKNGTILTQTQVQRRVSNNDVGALAVVAEVSLATNDYIELFAENNGNTGDVTAEYMYLSING